MPPVTQQGSRAGLITAVVIFVVLFVTATIFAIYYGVDDNRTKDDYALFKGTVVPRILPDGSTSSPQLDQLESLRNSTNAGKYSLNPSMPLLTVATAMRDNLKTLVDPSAVDAPHAVDSAQAAIAASAAKLKPAGVTLTPDSKLVPAVNSLTNAVLAKQTEIQTLKTQLASAQNEAKAKTDQFMAEKDAMTKTVDEVRGQATSETTAAATDRSTKQGQVTEIEAARTKERQVAQDEINRLNATLNAKNAESERLQKQLADVRDRLSNKRISTNEPIMRAADGTIVRVPGNGIVYISRGLQDQIVTGMTFEIYDKNEGIPRAGEATNDDKLPEGKASIEVIRVGPTSSECRIIHVKPNTVSIQEGDLIANLVYDPNVKYKFFVPADAKFDLDQNGIATRQDTEVIRRLITQWGGKLQDKINVDTDFVIMGIEPVVHPLIPEDEDNPVAKQRRTTEEADLAAYQDVLAKAKELHIPTLNQNRFLYLIGYYEKAPQAAK